jgi:O-antigen/teichoic acid export membrane protein
MAGYGLQFQIITASQALREPVTKALLAKFGGLSMTGYYDLASRWVVTIRELIVQANQVLIPAISHLRERDPDSVPAVYRESYRLVFFLAVPAFTAVTILSPVVSRLWIGSHQPLFVEFVAILAAGWLVNVLSNPAYVVGLGIGTLGWILAGCLTTVVLNASLGWIAGVYFGATVIVAVSAFSLAVGYIMIAAAYHRENRVPFAVLLPTESSRVLLACATALALFFILVPQFAAHSFDVIRWTETTSAALVAAILIPMWLHPLRKRLLRWALSRAPA